MQSEVMTAILQILIPAVITALGVVITALANNIAGYLKQRANSNLLNRYIDILTDVVIDVVQSLNQTTVERLKEAAADGKLTQDEINMISAQALDAVKTILGTKGLEILKIAFEDVDSLIANKIERAVREVKIPEEVMSC